MIGKDPYSVLGVKNTSSQEEIVSAYRKLVLQYHPDKNLDNPKEAADKFKEITNAFEIIGDPQKRSHYDSFGFGNPTFSFRSRNSVDDVFDNIFSHVFGDQKKGQFNSSRLKIKISLKESYYGCTRKVKFDNHKSCEDCKGTGSISWEQCSECRGKGFVVSDGGFVRMQSSCSSCQGRGSVSKESCNQCNSRGYVVESQDEMDVKIPAGIEDGTQIRLSGKSNKDLYLHVNVEKDSKFIRENKYLIGSLEVPYHILVLGGEVDFEVFETKLKIKIHPRFDMSSRLRIKNQGMPHIQNPEIKGDLLLDIKLKMPEKITKQHEKLLNKIAELDSNTK